MPFFKTSRMTTTHKGTPVFYTDQGEGNAIVLLHGFLENSTMWESFALEFSKNYRVICIDLLGHGKTGCIGYIHTMEDMAAGINTVLEDLQIQTVTIIGHSMGGYVGCAFAKAYPKKTKALCLLNSTPLPDNAERKLLRIRANKMARENYSQLVRMSFMNLFDKETRENYNHDIDLAIIEALQTPTQGYIAANSGMQLREDSSKLWREGNFYKAILLGETDWIIDSNMHKLQFGSYTDYLKIIPGGHMSHISQETILLKHLMQIVQANN